MKKLIAIVSSLFLIGAAHAAEITGAGATFPQPIYTKWADSYFKKTGNTLNYQSIGSGAGIKQIDAKTVTFGATDVPLKQEDLDKKGQVQFPMIVGGIVPIFNIPGVNEITLTTDVIAKIYLDKINNWNDKEIAALNPGVKLPDLTIVKVRRSDGSGTTWNFTKYLTEANEEWKSKFGFGTAIEWAGNSVGAKGNDGVANNVIQTKGAIGYVEYAFAKNNKLSVAYMNDKNGQKVVASLDSFQNNWPMVATSYIVMYKNPDDKEASKHAIEFFKFCFENDEEAKQLDYVPLTKEQKETVKKIWQEIK